MAAAAGASQSWKADAITKIGAPGLWAIHYVLVLNQAAGNSSSLQNAEVSVDGATCGTIPGDAAAATWYRLDCDPAATATTNSITVVGAPGGALEFSGIRVYGLAEVPTDSVN